MSFRLYVGASPSGFVELLKVPFGPAYEWDTATLGLDSNGLQAAMQRYDGQPSPAASDGVQVVTASAIYGKGFQHVLWDIDLRSQPKKIAVYVDGVGKGEFSFTGHATSVGPAVLAIGTLYRNGDGPMTDTYVDDVIVQPQ